MHAADNSKYGLLDLVHSCEHRTSVRCKWFILFLSIFIITWASVTHLSKASLYGVFNIFTVDLSDHSSNNQLRDPSEYVLLENFSEKQSLLTGTRLNIFFVQTSENEDILSRHACSIESAAHLHPTGNILVLMRSRHILAQSGSFIHLHSYDNIHIVHFDEEDVYSGTPLIRLNQTKRQQYIHYFSISHMSDFLRTALLYKYGGVYFDLDVIPLKKFHFFRNAVALETADGVNVAALVFEKRHLVLSLQMDIQLKTVSSHFHGLCWNCLGPAALTDALKNACDQHRLHVHQPMKCQRIDIHPSHVFYPIPYQQIPQFFRQSFENVDRLLKNSSIHAIHYFHHMTMNIPIEKSSPFAQIAALYCPNVYNQLLNENTSSQSSNFLITNVHIAFFCLCISLLCLFLLFILGHLFAYLAVLRKSVFATQKRFHKTHC